jgi:UDP-glucose 4-epimerase
VKRIVVTGASTPIGRRVVAALAGRDDVATVVGVDGRAPPTMPRVVDEMAADTIVHAAMCPTRSGAAGWGSADVIATMQIAAAASDRKGPVRAVVAVASTEVYGASAAAPLWRREDEALRPAPGSEAAVALEAEGYLRELAEHHPHISVAVLRLADLAGAGITSPLASLLTGRVVPFVPGYDPAVQFLHVDDAVRAVAHAVDRELAGTYNVAAPDVLRWRAAGRLARRPILPAPGAPVPFAGFLTRLGFPEVPAPLLDVLRFSRCVDTSAISATGFRTAHGTEACVRTVRDG